MLNPLPPLRDNYGNPINRHQESDLSVSMQTYDLSGAERLAAFGEVLIAELAPKTAWRFDYGTVPNTRLYTSTTANAGAASVTQSRLLLETGTNTAGMARVQTQRRLRYMPGMGGLIRFTAVFGTPKANARQIIGQGDAQDGFFFGYNGTSFGTFLRRAGVDTFTVQADWNRSPVEFNPAFGNVYQIRYQWLGFGFIRYYVLHPTDPNRGFVPVHAVLYPNTQTVTSILNPTLPLMAEVLNSGNNTNVTLMTPSGMGGLEGETNVPFNPLNVSNSFDAATSFANTDNNHFFTIRNKTTFGGVANRVPITINSLNIARGAAGAPLTNIRMYRNATTAGALTYADVDTNNSPVETSITTTTITSASPERAYIITDQVTLQTIDFRDKELVLQPGESLTIGVQNSTNPATQFAGTLNWWEEF